MKLIANRLKNLNKRNGQYEKDLIIYILIFNTE